MPARIDLPCDELVQRYANGDSTIRLAAQYRCSPTTVAKRLHACGAVLRPSRFQASHVPEAELRRLYLDQHLPITAIAAHFAVSVSTIGNKRRRYHIPVRGRRTT